MIFVVELSLSSFHPLVAAAITNDMQDTIVIDVVFVCLSWPIATVFAVHQTTGPNAPANGP